MVNPLAAAGLAKPGHPPGWQAGRGWRDRGEATHQDAIDHLPVHRQITGNSTMERRGMMNGFTRMIVLGMTACSLALTACQPKSVEEDEVAEVSEYSSEDEVRSSLDAAAPAFEATASAPKLVPGMRPDLTAISDWGREYNLTGPYVGIYDSTVEAVESSVEPGMQGAGRYCFKVTSAGDERSGITTRENFLQLEPGKRYQIECKIYTAEPVNNFMLGLKNEGAGFVWSNSVTTKRNKYPSMGARWEQMRGELVMPAETSGVTQFWILQWDRAPLTWYIDDLRLSE